MNGDNNNNDNPDGLFGHEPVLSDEDDFFEAKVAGNVIFPRWRTNARKELGNTIVDNVSPHNVVASCVNCRNFTLASTFCEVYKAQPPAQIIAYGCDRYQDEMNIPF